MALIQLVLIEDEPQWQQAIAALLSSEPDMQLCAVSDRAEDGPALVAQWTPDLVLIDNKLKGPMDGLTLARDLQAHYPPERLIIISGSPPDQLGDHPFAYVPKSMIARDLVPTMRQGMAIARPH